MEGQERERSEIGKELHDNINQILASVKLMITATIAKSKEPDDYLLDAIKLTDECIQEIRRLSNSLIPLREKEIELMEAIEGVVGRIKATAIVMAIVEERKRWLRGTIFAIASRKSQ